MPLVSAAPAPGLSSVAPSSPSSSASPSTPLASSTSTTTSSSSSSSPSHKVQPPPPAPYDWHHAKDSARFVVLSLAAGGIAGCAAKTVVAPLDRVKILFQVHNPVFERYSGTYLGAFRAVASIYQSQGIPALYKGHSAMLVRIFPYAAIQYMSYEQFKRILMPDPSKSAPWIRILCGSLAGATSVLFTYPLDLVRARMAHDLSAPIARGGLARALATVYKEGGIRSLYRGFIPTLLGILPYGGASFFSYETLKTLCLQVPSLTTVSEDSRPKLGVWTKLACGGIAGAVAQTVAYPLDVVRRRVQLAGSGVHVAYNNKWSWNAARDAVRGRGWQGLFVGLSINYLKVAPSVSVSFVTYEYMKDLFGIHGGESGGI